MRRPYSHDEFTAWLRGFAAARFIAMNGALWGVTRRNRRSSTLPRIRFRRSATVPGAFTASAALFISPRS